ncbi:MAG: hypothetical protein V1810_01285 [Candidatus Beckwithbacteria bacterium]
MNKDFILAFEKVLETLNLNTNLLKITNNKIITPLGDIVPLLIKHKSNLSNMPIDFNKLKKLTDKLSSSIIRLNHVGFCYKTFSNIQEKLRLIKLAKKTKIHLYEEPSNDDGLWLFLGNTDQWEKPMIEMVPIEKTNDKWKEYWLPHVQIDLDTKLSAQEVISLVKLIYGNSFKPHFIVINGVTYIVRCWLGVIDGVNIFLDLATKARNVEYSRKNILVKLT